MPDYLHMAASVWKGMSPWVRLYSSTPRLQAVPGRGRYSLHRVQVQGVGTGYRYSLQARGTGSGTVCRYSLQARGAGTNMSGKV
jgi:hypothetical protein